MTALTLRATIHAMIEALPRRAFFRFEFPLRHRTAMRITANGADWSAAYILPALIELEGTPPIADVYAGWNDGGLQFLFDVPERTSALSCDPKRWWERDGLRLCIDTRDTRDARRQTRFCHFFYVLPTGGGDQGRAPVVGLHRMSHAKETPPPVDTSAIEIAVQVRRRGYSVGVGIPASCLHGWDPQEHPRLGFCYKLKDLQLGQQHFSATDELGWNQDPSTWATGVLVD